MPCLLSNDDLSFPGEEAADEDGLLAVGGDLSVDRLLAAYSRGIFPWYSEGVPILWWTPDPRFVLFPGRLHVSASMRKILGRHEFAITSDTAFDQVIGACRKARRREKGTWITDAIVEGYTALHEAGYAHSVEAWKDGRLAGGLYGVSLGGIFFGESMFSASPNASKAAFITLVRSLQEWKFRLIDCQVQTGHLASLGAEMIPRTEFLGLLAGALQEETRKGPWTLSRAGG